MTARLEENDSEYLDAVSEVLYCEGWTRNNKDGVDLEFADDHIISLKDRFEIPLGNAGLQCSEVELLDEWHDLLQYTQQFLSPINTAYLKTWRHIFSSPRSQKDLKNILLLVEFVFTDETHQDRHQMFSWR